MSWMRFTGSILLVVVGLAKAVAAVPPETPETPARPGPNSPTTVSGESNARDAAATQPGPGLVATRQLGFSIPFSVSNARDPGSRPAEVQLFVSDDQGANWSLYARQRPSAGRFQFNAPRDGTYWFLVRTADRSGRVQPSGPMRPELRVLVDTAPPVIDFEATAGPRGEIVTRWTITDSQLLPETFTLEYQIGASRSWQSVAVNRRSAGNSTTRLVGTEIWWPHAVGKSVALRARVRDAAGNSAVVDRRVQLPNVATWTPKTPAKPADEPSYPPVHSPIQPPVATQVPSVGVPTTGVPTTGAPTTGVQMKPLAGQVPAGSSGVSRPRSPVRWPADNRPKPAARSAQAEPSGTPARPASHPGESRDVRPAASQPSAAPPRGALPRGALPRMIASRQFNMEYDVEQVGPGGLDKVVLWITRDGGQSWQPLVTDEDKQSPITVQMQADGVFGYRLVLHGVDGMAGHVPRAGDTADVWVGIDTARPTVRITSARYGKGRELGQLEIVWRAEDQRLADRPITLQFSGHIEGPWSTIAAGLADTGRYVWHADNRIPRELYLRIEARDAAGNVGVYQMAEPISTAGLAPAGRIRAIQPADDIGLGAFRQRRYR